MGLFSITYRDVPGQAVIAQGGLKFRADERALRQYFAPILAHIDFEDLLGEAVFYVRMPALISALVFPMLLVFTSGSTVAVVTFLLLVGLKLAHRFVYLKSLNYAVFVFGNPVGLLLMYGVWAVALWRSGAFIQLGWLAAAWVIFAFGLSELVDLPLDLIFLSRLYSLPLSDQILRTVGWSYAAKEGLDPTTWTMTR